jgi:signal transduction histidine kinase
LGVTFFTILLLVYHFKQRIINIELRTDKMFEIVNNIVESENKKYEPDFAERTTTPHTHGVIEHTTPMAETR